MEQNKRTTMFLHFLIGLSWFTSGSAATEAKPGCPEACGNVKIPYPFGVGSKCSIHPSYSIDCNSSYELYRPFISATNLQVMSISQTEMRISSQAAVRCYGDLTTNNKIKMDLSRTPYTFSDTKNKFYGIGCNTMSVIFGNLDFIGCCASYCGTNKSIQEDESCSGIGCCHTSIPKGLKLFETKLTAVYNQTDMLSFGNYCMHGFMAEQENYKFSVSDLQYDKFNDKIKGVPVVLDWAIGENQTCLEAQKNLTAFACKDRTTCYNVNNSSGYRCSCIRGYEGNPYLTNGCQDVNECKDNRCVWSCKNTPGSYKCSCPKGAYGDGKIDGTGCIQNDEELPTMKVALGVSLGFLCSLLGISCLYFSLKKRKLVKLKEKFFLQNGGLLLKQQISSSHEGSVESAKIFTANELKLATNNYDESRILGKGGFGTVYKGILPDKRIVAIKKSKHVDESQMEQFINEFVILTQVNHRNVVKLLGCCLETEVPLLVYEYISNGNLSEHIHNISRMSSISWEDRLRIAAETAGALAYLHSAASIPVIHRDVKSANILLDGNYTAKVADFGASRLVPLDQTQITTLVQGTLGYLDPEYLHTSHLTQKSDVYSFGVVLVELLTGKKPLSFTRSEEDRSLATYFIVSVKENRLFQLLEPEIANEGKTEQIIAFSELAKRCLNLKGEKRPTMKEVAMELEGLRRLEMHPWAQHRNTDSISLLSETQDSCYVELTSYTGNASGRYSTEVFPR
ncbi:hypothetical protein GIB67_024741 [Kingdonia uniflora]|uniref:Protein kinase domain-containing protein n=1 Tax=Kingdonia uniflora TaxID=39325 RepID=A0A7J7N9S2_9MAGN|nr:hypothetical protein GIB67_024741 [Kingdonia uniflora]